MTQSKRSDQDRIDEFMENSWETMPAALHQRLLEIPEQLGPRTVPAASGFELILNAIVYVVIYLWMAGMVMIFQSTLITSIQNLGGLVQRLTPMVSLPSLSPWIPLGLLLMAVWISMTRFLPPLQLMQGRERPS